jgi:hypothetical protein
VTCPRNFPKEEIIARLKAGQTLVVDRRDAPELQDLMELEQQGLVQHYWVEIDEQHTVVKWRWKGEK